MPIGFVGPALQGANMISKFGVPLLQQAGIGLGAAGLGALFQAGANKPGTAPQRNRRTNVGSNRYSGLIGSIPPSANGESYRRAELRLGDAARAGGGGGGGGNAGYSVPRPMSGAPADRAYEQEKARVAQMTEQDPMFKKYKIAELTKAYNTASPEEKDKIGLQIWATTNPELAQKLKPGQTGFQEASSVFGTQTYGTGQPGITQTDLTQFAEKVGAPSMEAPTDFGQTYGAQIPGVGLGVNAQQLAYSPEGEMPPEMLDAGVFSTAGLMNKPADLTQMQLKLLKQAFNSRIK